MSVAKNIWIRNIHIAKTKTGLSDDEYRILLSGATGIQSATELTTWQQYESTMAAFSKLGFRLSRNTAKKQDRSCRNPQMISAKQEYYIRGLWLLASKKKDERSLRAIIRRIAGVDDITFLKKCDATNVILALRTIAGTAGYNPDGKEVSDAADCT